MKVIEPLVLVAFFLGFITLGITAMVIHSIPMLLLAFVVGFLGYAICESAS